MAICNSINYIKIGVQRLLPVVPSYCIQLAFGLVLFVPVLFILVNFGHSGKYLYTYPRGRLKSTGNYSVASQNITSPITWDSLGKVLPGDVTDVSFPDEFFRCTPAQILKVIHRYDSSNSLPRCDRIIYNRVPKCGSRTMLSVFRVLATQSNYTVYSEVRPEGRSYLTSVPKLIKFGMNFSQLEEPFLYSQHLHFVNFTQLGIPPPLYINVIRDPVDRVISHFYYNKYGSGFDAKELSRNNISLDDCIQSIDDCPYLPIHMVLPFFCGQTKFCRAATEGALERAMRAVRQSFLVVGLTEDLPAFLDLLESLMPHFFTNATNVYNEIEDQLFNKTQTVKKPPVRFRTIQILKDLLSKEYEFYEFIKQRFYTLYHKVRSVTFDQGMELGQRHKRSTARIQSSKRGSSKQQYTTGAHPRNGHS